VTPSSAVPMKRKHSHRIMFSNRSDPGLLTRIIPAMVSPRKTSSDIILPVAGVPVCSPVKASIAPVSSQPSAVTGAVARP